jgi:hypothetical protein
MAALLGIASARMAGAQVTSGKAWTPATYRGLVMGKSTRADVYQTLGKPQWSGLEEDTGVPIIGYDAVDPMPGSLIVYIHGGVLRSMTLYPKKDMVKDDIIRLFGTGYRIVHYSTDDCLEEGGAAPSYEDPNGLLTNMEYRDRGLAAVFRYANEDQVEAIIFLSNPHIPTRSVCATKGKKK